MSEERNAYHKAWRDAKAKEDPFYSHKKALRELYKTTKEWYDSKLLEQEGHCALCPNTVAGGKRLHVDHDHTCCSGKRACGECNRGLLCGGCNIRLGYLQLLLGDFPKGERQEICEVDFRNMVAKDSWTHKALQYLRKYA